MSIHFRAVWRVQVEHAFRTPTGPSDEFSFLVPPATQRKLDGLRLLARERDGQLHLLIELDDTLAPVAGAAVVGQTLLFGLLPRHPGFALYTQAPAVAAGELPLWANDIDPHNLAAPRGVALADLPDAAGWGDAGQRPTGLLQLQLHASHLVSARSFTLALQSRQDLLRYYVVGRPFPAAEFDALEVVDEGSVADDRAPITFNRVAPAAFTPAHLQPALLDASGSARIVLFEAQAPTARRERGPTRLRLRVGADGDTLTAQLPTPGGERPDGQFVVHLNKS